MKIIYIVPDFGQVSETFVSDLVNDLAQQIGHLTVLCNRSWHCSGGSTEVREVRFLSLDNFFNRFLYRLMDLRTAQLTSAQYQLQLHHARRRLAPILKELQPDAAYIDFGTVAVMARQALTDLKIPFVVHFHGADISSALNNFAYRQELQSVFQQAATLIVASDHIRRLLILEGAPREKIAVVRHGINLAGVTPRTWDERYQHAPSVIFLGRFTPKKNPIALVEAFALVKQEVPQTKLSLIGDGPEMSQVKQRVEKLNLRDAIKLYGALPHKQALTIMNEHWVYAQHSVTATTGDQEGFGVSLAEAAALGLPVVSTLHNGIPEQVIDGETGFLVREFDYETMAERMITLLEKPTLAKEMGESGRINILSLCQPQKRVRQIVEILSCAQQGR